jgi:hypothetical protein
MTICIAAAILHRTIVTISDRKISLGDFASDEVAEKIDFIHRHWAAMVSADDISLASPVWKRMRENLGYTDSRTEQVGEKTLSDVVDACVSAYGDYRKELVTAQFYKSHGLTEERFISEGRKLLGLSLFTETWNKVEQFKTGFSFLVSGFDREGQAHLFVVDDPGVLRDFGPTNFWAIGSGQPEALSSIFFTLAHLQDFPQTLNGMIYDLCAAKFMAEANSFVGNSTNVIIRRFQEAPEYYPDESIAAMRQLWEQGRPRRPQNTDGIVDSLRKHRIDLRL